MFEKLPDDLKTDIIKEKPPEIPKTPPPPPPDLIKPPPPSIPPPDIQIQSAPSPNTITQVTTQPPPPQVVAPPKPAVVAPTLAAGRGNNCAASYYPPIAMRLNHEGSTTVSIHISADGSVKGVDVAGSSGFSDLDDAAIKCITARWHFSPATENGSPIESTKQYRVVWKLSG